MHATQATHALVGTATPQIAHEIPTQLHRLRDNLAELGRRSDVLLGRLESVRRIPPPAASSDQAPARTSPVPVYAVPQTPLGTSLDELAREIDQQIRSVNHAIDTLELA